MKYCSRHQRDSNPRPRARRLMNAVFPSEPGAGQSSRAPRRMQTHILHMSRRQCKRGSPVAHARARACSGATASGVWTLRSWWGAWPAIWATSSDHVAPRVARCVARLASKYDAPGVHGRHQHLQLALLEHASLPLPTTTSGSRRTLVATGYTAAGLDTSTASGTLIIGRIDLHFVAACHGTVPLGANLPSTSSQRLASTDALLCRFSAAVSLQEMRCLSDPAENLPLRVAEGMTKSSESVRVLAVVAGVCGAFKRAFWHLGCQAL